MLRFWKCTGAAMIAYGVLSGCTSGESWKTHDISSLVPDLAFTLTDDRGRSVSAQDYRGKVALLFFGFTHCPDVCPTTLARLARTIQATDGGRDDVRVLVVTVDPARDSTAVMHEYVQAFGPQFVGLRGDAAALEALARRYRVAYALGKPDARGNYEVTHSSAVFVFDREGRARLLFSSKDTPAATAEDLRRVILDSSHGAG
ncbi:MAG: SCO family protein [Burkholderiales bacterium]|nr:SCO family protein [Burkholderiales bacterium]